METKQIINFQKPRNKQYGKHYLRRVEANGPPISRKPKGKSIVAAVIRIARELLELINKDQLKPFLLTTNTANVSSCFLY